MAELASYDAAAVRGALSWPAAVAALRAALLAGLDPEAEPPRASHPFGAGELLTMPSSDARWAGVKLATVAPENPDRGLPRVHAVFVLFDAESLAPVAVLDGTALTALRTPAVSALGVDLLALPDASRLVVFGAGPQAYEHVHALRAVRPVSSVRVVSRTARRAAALVERLRADGVRADTGDPGAVADADLVVCATTAREPVFDGRLLPDTAVVVAVGSHEPAAREVDAHTVRRCGVAVESRSVALREAGDVIAAGPVDLVTLAELVRGETTARPRLIKTVGMGWEDLVVAAAVVRELGR